MGRTLPWLKEQPKSSKPRERTARPVKRPKLEQPDEALGLFSSEDEEKLPPRGTLRSRSPVRDVKSRRKAAYRTPSTSPPPAPPPEELMREGLSGDDIYIMVEDEFLATAQAFTTHLHYAEYKRLKALAAESNKHKSATSSHHPIESLSKLSEELRMRKLQASRAARNKEALQEIGIGGKSATSRTKRMTARDGEKEEEDEEDGSSSDVEIPPEDDPWAGTTLQGLMTSSPQQSKTSALVGIHGVASSTRAAAGYSKPHNAKADTSRMYAIGEHKVLSPSLSRKPGPGKIAREVGTEESTPSHKDNDDLETMFMLPALRRRKTATMSANANDRGINPSKSLRSIVSPRRGVGAGRVVSFQEPPNTYNNTTTNTNPEEDDDDLSFSFRRPTPLLHSGKFDAAARAKKRQERERQQKEQEKEKEQKQQEQGGAGKTNVNEIPIFLV